MLLWRARSLARFTSIARRVLQHGRQRVYGGLAADSNTRRLAGLALGTTGPSSASSVVHLLPLPTPVDWLLHWRAIVLMHLSSPLDTTPQGARHSSSDILG